MNVYNSYVRPAIVYGVVLVSDEVVFHSGQKDPQ